VGVYFVTQNPLDVPDSVLGQLGNRVQHALRAFTPRDQKAVKTAAETMRANPAFDAATAITELGVGEALISFLDEKGRPSIVERCSVIAPCSRLGPMTATERQAAIQASLIYGHYEQLLDRESAYERLRGAVPGAQTAGDAATAVPAAGGAPPAEQGGGLLGGLSGALGSILFGRTGPRGGQYDGLVQTAAKTVARTVAGSIGREIARGVLGSLLGGAARKRR
jgi:DNA helicase HerA-like ATPase